MSSVSFYGSLLIVSLLATPSPAANLVVEQAGTNSNLRVGGGQVFHTTAAQVTDTRAITFAGSATMVAVWKEHDVGGTASSNYAISFDGAAFPIIRRVAQVVRPGAIIHKIANNLCAISTIRWAKFDSNPLSTRIDHQTHKTCSCSIANPRHAEQARASVDSCDNNGVSRLAFRGDQC